MLFLLLPINSFERDFISNFFLIKSSKCALRREYAVNELTTFQFYMVLVRTGNEQSDEKGCSTLLIKEERLLA